MEHATRFNELGERAFSKVQVDNQGMKIIKLIEFTMEEKSGT